MGRRGIRLTALLLLSAWIAGAADGQEIPAGGAGAPPSEGPWAVLVSPAENGLAIGRKPPIQGAFLREIDTASVTIVVDGTDYTAVATRGKNGFEVTPPLPLPPGSHQVTVSARDASGASLSYQASFHSKHSVSFDEAVSRNDLTGTYDVALHKSAGLDNTVNNAREEGNLSSSSLVRKGPWKVSLDGTARYKDQSLPVPLPERKGGDIINYTFRAGFDRQPVKVEGAVGDVTVNETPYTIPSLARRGATLEADTGTVFLRGFTVRSDTVYGIRGGYSFDGDRDRNLRGGAGGVRLFGNRMELRGVFVDGAEIPGSYNVATAGGEPRSGDVLGFLWLTDFFAGKFRTDIEADFSRFRHGTADNTDANRDRAFRIRAFGSHSIFNYEALFERIGRDYEIVGNPGLARNREGGKVSAGANSGRHSLAVSISRYNDNVRGDDAFPVNVQWHGEAMYGLNRWQSLPISLAVAWDRQRGGEPPAVDNTGMKTDNNALNKDTATITAQVTHNTQFAATSLSGAYSRTIDRSADNADTDMWNARLAPTFTFGTTSVTPSAAYSEASAAGARTDTTTLGLDGRTQLFRNKVTGELGSTFVRAKRSDRTQDSDTVTENFRIGYAFDPLFRGYFRPSLAFHGTYTRVKDRVIHASSRDDWALFLTVSAQIPIVF